MDPCGQLLVLGQHFWEWHFVFKNSGGWQTVQNPAIGQLFRNYPHPNVDVGPTPVGVRDGRARARNYSHLQFVTGHLSDVILQQACVSGSDGAGGMQAARAYKHLPN